MLYAVAVAWVRTFDHSSMSISPAEVSTMTRPFVGSAMVVAVVLQAACKVNSGRVSASAGVHYHVSSSFLFWLCITCVVTLFGLYHVAGFVCRDMAQDE